MFFIQIVRSQTELESENQSLLQLGPSTVDTGSSTLQINGKHKENNDPKQSISQVLPSGTEDSPQALEEGLRKNFQGTFFKRQGTF